MSPRMTGTSTKLANLNKEVFVPASEETVSNIKPIKPNTTVTTIPTKIFKINSIEFILATVTSLAWPTTQNSLVSEFWSPAPARGSPFYAHNAAPVNAPKSCSRAGFL